MVSHDENRDILLMRALSGDVESFICLVEYYQDDAYRLALVMLADVQEAQRVVAEGFVDAFALLPGYHIGTDFRAWLIKILYNRIAEILHSRKNKLKTLPEFSWADAALAVFLRRSFALAPAEKALVVFRYLYDFSCKDAAAIVGMRELAVTARLKRARHCLSDDQAQGKVLPLHHRTGCPSDDEIDDYVENPQAYTVIANHLQGCRDCMKFCRMHLMQVNYVQKMLQQIPHEEGISATIGSMFAEIEKDSNILTVLIIIALIAGAMLLCWIFVALPFTGSGHDVSIIRIGGAITTIGRLAADMDWMLDGFREVGNFLMLIPVVIFIVVLYLGKNKGGIGKDEEIL